MAGTHLRYHQGGSSGVDGVPQGLRHPERTAAGWWARAGIVELLEDPHAVSGRRVDRIEVTIGVEVSHDPTLAGLGIVSNNLVDRYPTSLARAELGRVNYPLNRRTGVEIGLYASAVTDGGHPGAGQHVGSAEHVPERLAHR